MNSKNVLLTIVHNGRKLSFVEVGSGAPIMLLPPGASSATAWRGVTDDLSSRFRTVAVNPSGYEATEAFVGEKPMSLDDEATAVMAVVADRRLDSPHLVGHSYGGAIALRLALLWPARFRSLTLIEPAAYPLLRHAGEDSLASEVEEVNRHYIERVLADEPESAFQSYFDYYNGADGAWSRLPSTARTRLLSIAETVASALTAVHASPTRLEECAMLSLPTMLIRGSQTDRVHSHITELLAKTIPQARLKVVDGAGHMLTLTHPIVVSGLIESHVGGCSSAAS